MAELLVEHLSYEEKVTHSALGPVSSWLKITHELTGFSVSGHSHVLQNHSRLELKSMLLEALGQLVESV